MGGPPGTTTLDREAAAKLGMGIAVTAREAPERCAIRSPAGDRSFSELNRNANRLARALRVRGLGAGDAIALLSSNRPEFAEVYAAALRAGMRLTCVNWHLQPDEIAYIVDNCEARTFIADARFGTAAAEVARACPAATTRLALAGDVDGFESYDAALEGSRAEDLEDPVLGGAMLYTSGTTGRPKGVFRRTPPRPNPDVRRRPGFRPGEDTCLCTGPLYHAAPLGINLARPLLAGVGVVLMDGWDAEATLRLIERERVTHTHMVATMFSRLLALPENIRHKYDLSSLRYLVHGAAPTPVHVKKAMLDWLGPVIYEYYAATEGSGTYITPEEWLQKPGSVGRPNPGQGVEIRDDDGRPLPTGEVGTIYLKAPEVGRFEYFNDPEQTAASYRGDFFTLGDQGRFDGDGYLFLTGRTSELIISGGVNIYPAEIDAVLLMHPAVADAATVGAPNDDWGEEVVAIVQLEDRIEASPALADELIQFCRERLAHYKCPRRVDWDPELPRSAAGKIYRRVVRDRYWADRDRRI